MLARMINILQVLRRNPAFTRVWIAQAISLLGDWFNTIVLAALVSRYTFELTGDASRSGLAVSGLLLARFLPPLLVSPLGGVLLDRFDRKNMLIASDVARVFIVLGFLLATTPDRLWLIYLLTALQFGASAVFEPGRSAILPSITRAEDLVTANLLSSAIWSVMLAVGGVLGGLISGWLGTGAAIVFDASTFAVSALLIASINIPLDQRTPTEAHEKPKASARDFTDGLRYARKNPPIAAALLIKFGGNIGSIDTILIIFGTALFVIGDDGVLSLGMLWGAFGIGAVLGPIILARSNDGSIKRMRRLVILGYASVTLGWLLLGGSPTLAVAALAIIVKAIGSSIYWTYSSVILQKSVDGAYIGRMFSLDFAGFQFATVVSVIVTGLALEVLGNDQVRTVVYVTALASAVPLIAWIVLLPILERYELQQTSPNLPLSSDSVGTFE